ncbi:MAG TPA: hypothetical protein PKC18_08960 [Lacipirellulaceae bacterium]|nr:hypothetical protein [Lacipirellulaceae bacterium]
MSIAAEPWADHLLQQVQWIMELIGPDAIVVDETFAGLGYDGRGGGALDGPRSIHMIRWLKRLRALVRSFGEDRAVLSSDCGLAGFSMWCDAEGGDHAYPQLLGLPQYRAAPARYRAALGDKPWLPCAWQCNRLWDEQLDLARATGAAVGLSNGWIEYTGLTGLEALRRARMLGDLTMLRQACAGSQVVSDRTGGDKHG